MQPQSPGAIGVGVIGCGYWGPNLVRNLHALPECSVRWMCDTSDERLRHMRGLYPGIEATKSYRRVLEDPSVHAVAIATGARLHFPMAKAALLAGKHVLVEKPMAQSSAECDELIKLAGTVGRLLMVGHTFLYSPAVRKIKELIDSGHIGTLRYISARRLNLGLFQRDVNVAWDLAPHDLSIILYLMQEQPVTVTCTGSAHVSDNVQDVTAMCLQFSGNKSALIHSSWLDPRKIREMTVVGSERMIVYDDVAPREKIRIFDAKVETPPHYDTYAEFHFAYHYGDVHIPYLKQEEPLKNECAHFVECIRQGSAPLTPGEDGRAVVRILEASSSSLRQNGAPVSLARPVPNLPAAARAAVLKRTNDIVAA